MSNSGGRHASNYYIENNEKYYIYNRIDTQRFYVEILLKLVMQLGMKLLWQIKLKKEEYIMKFIILIKAFQSENSEENKILLEVFLSYVFDSKVLEIAYKQEVNTSNMFKQLLEERFVRVSNELIEKMWSKIDTQEFINKILTQNYTIYSIDNWSRKSENI